MKNIRDRIITQVNKVVVGQNNVIDGCLIALAVGGHVLLEGPPGTAKTLIAQAIAKSMGVEFTRTQFTPDMLPSDVTGTTTLNPSASGTYELAFRPGPIFTNIFLADEINRTPPKTQAALLEAMQEQQVSADGTSHPLPDPFLVIATQNPIEYEGTYPLPEAQLDRFTLKIDVGYPDEEAEHAMLRLLHSGVKPSTLSDVEVVASPQDVASMRQAVDAVVVSEEVISYVTNIVRATRTLPALQLGASPRAAVNLLAAAKATAQLFERDYVTPDDVAFIAPAVLRHRLILAPEAELERVSADSIIAQALHNVAVPR
ncbi:MAG TPA: MoxR family ATPase [Acidimicrobiia bacterium]|jgi:MoxR-like ATPase|nr:MoxR family ATPase [Acidimicrobiia bacterium]